MAGKSAVKMMSLPRVSVLMPLYNTPISHLKEAIDSILSQTFTDFEYLILNDSPENTALDEAVRAYSDPRVIYFKNEKNLGLEASTNRLIDESSGEYIAIFDHDDISLPERLEKEVAYLDKNPSTGVVSGQFRVFGNEDIITENPIESSDIKEALMTVSCVSHTSAMFRRSVLEKNSIRYEKDYFPASSYRIITRLALVTDIHNLPDTLLHYRMDGNNTSIIHAESRVYARQKIQSEYGKDRVRNALVTAGYRIDALELLGDAPFKDERRYYHVRSSVGDLFVKSEVKSLANELDMAQRMFKRSPKFFIEPLELLRDGRRNYLVMRWSEGENLEEYMNTHTITQQQEEAFIDDLYTLQKALYNEGIVHRDITPINLIVVSNSLKLIDLHFAVDFNKYEEAEYIKDNIGSIGLLGEPYAADMYKWDDAFSLVAVAKFIIGDKAVENAQVKKIAKHIDERVIIPDASLLRKVVIEQSRALADLRLEFADLETRYEQLLAKNNSIESSMSYRLGNTIAYPYRAMKSPKGKK